MVLNLFLLSLLLTLTLSESIRPTLPRSEACLASLETCLPLAADGEDCPLLPIPAEARNPPVGEDGFILTRIRPGVFQYYDGFFTTIMMRSGDRFAFIDLPESPGSRTMSGSMTLLTNAAKVIIGERVPRRFDIIYSHSHADHIGTTERFIEFFKNVYPDLRIFIWGTAETRDVLRDESLVDIPLPNRIVGKRTRTVQLGRNLSIELTHLPGHSKTSLVALIPASEEDGGVVFYADVFFPLYAPPPNLGGTDDLTAYISAQEHILQLDFDTIVTAHVRLGSRRDLMTNLEYSKDLIDVMQAAIRTDVSSALGPLFARLSDPSDAAFGNSLFLGRDIFRGGPINVCIATMLEKWGCRIASVDITIEGNCDLAFNVIISLSGPF